MQEDSYRHKGMRRNMVEELRNKGIKDENVLNAINNVPRHVFLDSSFLEFAYQDKAFPIGSKQTISQPFTVAFQTSLLEIKKGMKVLEIGTGSGYQACVLAEMGAKVFTIERQRKLYTKTKSFLSKFPYNIKMFLGDGYQGLPTFGPFDRILITAAAMEIPQDLVDQMKVGGMMVIPLSENDECQTMLRLTKQDDCSLKREEYGDFKFVPMLKNLGDD